MCRLCTQTGLPFSPRLFDFEGGNLVLNCIKASLPFLTKKRNVIKTSPAMGGRHLGGAMSTIKIVTLSVVRIAPHWKGEDFTNELIRSAMIIAVRIRFRR